MAPRDDETLLRRAFEVARRSRANGDHPFGALLAGPDGEVLREQCDGYSAEGGDMTAHAERLLATWASRTHEPGFSRAARSIRPPSPAPCAPARSTGRVSAASSTARAKMPSRR